MKFLPVDVSTFSTMIRGNYIYVDKTKCIYDLFATGGRYYFLSRPRRFGKSLLISTLKELFEGNRELFEGLWIANSDYKWIKHPVIHLDFATIAHSNEQELINNLAWYLDLIAEDYNIDLSKAPSIEAKFGLLIKELAKKHGPNSVVLLIDEYDKPILDHIKDISVANKQREILKSFYEILKGMDAYLRAIFITGVTKFSKASIFSGINNLNDITLDKQANQLLGYTTEEIKNNFTPYIQELSQENQLGSDEIFDKIKQWYNGYRFSEDDTKVYNPFSVLYFLKKKRFSNYWVSSGTPAFLMVLLKKHYVSIDNIRNINLTADSLGSFELEDIPLIPLLFQSGYLTIKDFDSKMQTFTLDYPNKEVEESFEKYLLVALSRSSPMVIDNNLALIDKALQNNDIPLFCSAIENIFAHIPYNLHINKESYYHSLFQILLTVLGKKANSEILTDKGRIDLVLSVKSHIYIFELKIDSDPILAIKQIKEMKYYQRYINNQKKLILVGLAFNKKNKALRLECAKEELDV